MNDPSLNPVYVDFDVTPQPDETSCGPASLHAVYRFHGDELSLAEVDAAVPRIAGGGTLTVMLALDALRRGYRAAIYTSNLHLFDPTWFPADPGTLRRRLEAQMVAKPEPKLRTATEAYIEFLDRGGAVFMEDLNLSLFVRLLRAGTPILAGLNATWLYRCSRERQDSMRADDVAGEATGHFVVVHGVDPRRGTLSVADPYLHEPSPGSHAYTADASRVIAAILLGIMTYDAKLLVLWRDRGGASAWPT